MTSELSIFAAQLREFISFQAEEPTFGLPPDESFAAHSDAEFNGYAMVLFALQFKANPIYRKLCEARGLTPDVITHWKQIPAASTTAFKELEFTCLPPEQHTHVFHSSGTTGQKSSRHFHNAKSLAIYEASLLPWFSRHVVPDLRFANHDLRLLTPPPAEAPNSSLIYMFDTVRHKFGAPESAFIGSIADGNTWTLDFDATIAALNTQHSTLLLGTAFSFVHLLDFLEEKNLRFNLPSGSRVMETGGYKGRSRTLPKAELHKLITERLGIPVSDIICEYGMSELSSQAYDLVLDATRNTQHATAIEDKGREQRRAESRIFHFPPWSRAQIISPETGLEVTDGETGLIRVFDLANVFSVMAIQTEDLGIRQGDGFELLGRAANAELRGCSQMAT